MTAPVASRSSSACMNVSRSPSRIRDVLPVSTSVRGLHILVGVRERSSDLVAQPVRRAPPRSLRISGLVLLIRSLQEASLEESWGGVLVLRLRAARSGSGPRCRVGTWVRRTAESVLFDVLAAGPGWRGRLRCGSRPQLSSTSTSLSTSGRTSTRAKVVCRRFWKIEGLIRTRRWDAALRLEYSRRRLDRDGDGKLLIPVSSPSVCPGSRWRSDGLAPRRVHRSSISAQFGGFGAGGAPPDRQEGRLRWSYWAAEEQLTRAAVVGGPAAGPPCRRSARNALVVLFLAGRAAPSWTGRATPGFPEPAPREGPPLRAAPSWPRVDRPRSRARQRPSPDLVQTDLAGARGVLDFLRRKAVWNQVGLGRWRARLLDDQRAAKKVLRRSGGPSRGACALAKPGGRAPGPRWSCSTWPRKRTTRAFSPTSTRRPSSWPPTTGGPAVSCFFGGQYDQRTPS